MSQTLRFVLTHPLLPGPTEHVLDIEDGQELVAGRVATADLHLWVEDRRISRHHFSIAMRGRQLLLVNKSINGTIVNGQAVGDQIVLGDGDEIGLGELVIQLDVCDTSTGTFETPVRPAAARPAPAHEPALDDMTIHAAFVPKPPVPGAVADTRVISRDAIGPDLVGRVVGGYRFETALAPGALGPRFVAVQAVLDRHVEIQLVERARLAQFPGRIERLFRTARIAARLVHPNIVQIHDCGEIAKLDAYFMTTEHVLGVWLHARIADGPMPFALGEALRIVREIGAALRHIHAAKIIHRNVSPESIVLCQPGGAAKLAGLGLSKPTDEDVRLTGVRPVVGNLRYSAPEQLTNARQVDHRADQYALAAVLYHLVCGRPALVARSLAEQVKALAAQPRITAPSAVVRGLPETLDHVLAKAMAFDPADRYASIEAFIEALGTVDRQAHAPDASMLDRTRRTYLAMLPRIRPRPDIDWGVHFAPVDLVGGDFYDVFDLPDGRIGTMVGDVSGHGLDAAMAVGMAKTSCRIYAGTEGSPARALAAVNGLVRPQLAVGRFFSCCLGMLDPSAATFTFARGGHDPVLLHNPARDPPVRWLSPEGCALGIMPDRVFHQVELTLRLQPGDLLLLYTDGVPEATDADGEPFEFERLAQVVSRRRADEPCAQVVQRVAAALAAWCGSAPADDVTLLAFRWL